MPKRSTDITLRVQARAGPPPRNRAQISAWNGPRAAIAFTRFRARKAKGRPRQPTDQGQDTAPGESVEPSPPPHLCDACRNFPRPTSSCAPSFRAESRAAGKEEKKALLADDKEVYDEAKGNVLTVGKVPAPGDPHPQAGTPGSARNGYNVLWKPISARAQAISDRLRPANEPGILTTARKKKGPAPPACTAWRMPLPTAEVMAIVGEKAAEAARSPAL